MPVNSQIDNSIASHRLRSATAADGLEVPLQAICARPGIVPLPVRFGVPVPRGKLVGDHFSATLNIGDEHAVAQAEPLARWSDGSVRWVLIDAIPRATNAQRTSATLRLRATKQRDPGRVHVQQRDDAWIVDTGRAVFHVDTTTFRPFRSIRLEGNVDTNVDATAVQLVDDRNVHRIPSIERMVIESSGTVRTTIRAWGSFTGTSGLRWSARLSFFAHSGAVLLRFTIHNPHAARHRGGIWDLGDPGSRFFRSLDLTLARPAGPTRTVRWTIDEASPIECDSRLAIYQGSSGGENWQSPNHVDRDGRVPCVVPGCVAETSRGQRTGARASPVVACQSGDVRISVTMPYFWQQFPKAINVSDDDIRVGLYPGQWCESGSLFELQGGERKTHTVWMSFDAAAKNSADAQSSLPLAGFTTPLRLIADPAWMRDSKAIDYFVAPTDDPDDRFASYTEQAVAGPWSVSAGREVIDEYGWRHFGDVWANHEALHYTGPSPIISHYNNQFDYLNGAILQWLRSGDERWHDIVEPLAEHVMDIDRYHTEHDRAAYNGGLFWFTDHYLSAETSTHRTYSKSNAPSDGRPYGGGPGSEHNFATGLLHYHYLTGSEDARDAVLGLADWVIAMDDGRRTILGLVDPGPTGLASAHWSGEKKCPGRGAANSTQVLLDAWLLCGDVKYMAKAEELVRRSIHPEDDLAAANLLNAEKNWSYTMFLAAVDRFLSIKEEAGQIDDAYAYAQASFVHYASWMAEHERPYLDRPEDLEYPTEAWAAQEFRKANVLRRAARHVDAAAGRKLIERGTELAERAWSDLLRFDTQATARAMAVVLHEGLWDLRLRITTLAMAPQPRRMVTFGRPGEFHSQRHRVRERLKSPRGLASLAVALARYPFRRRNQPR